MRIIATHARPDPDALGALVAAHLLYPDAIPFLPPDVPQDLRPWVALYADQLGLRGTDDLDWTQVKEVILVDTQEPHRALLPLDPQTVQWRVWDHHPDIPFPYPLLERHVAPRGAATTLLVEALMQQGLLPDSSLASLMALGIHADTGHLLYPHSTPEDAQALSYLMRAGIDLSPFPTPLPDKERQLVSQWLAQSRTRALGPYTIATLIWQQDERLGMVADLIGQMASTLKADALIALVGDRQALHLFGRANEPALDLRKLLGAWQPHGHPGAIYIKWPPDVDAEGRLQQLLLALEKALPPVRRVRDVMSSPVNSLPPDATYGEARELLDRLGHGGLVVADGHHPLGVVSRRDLDRAARHGLTQAPLKAFMAQPVITIRSDAPLLEAQALMVRRMIGRLPVVDDGRLVGILTRSDLLATLYPQDDVTPQLEQLFPRALVAFLRQVGRLAPYPIYLAGGAVRDLLLARPGLIDLDLVVEGDAVAVAKFLAEKLGARLGHTTPFGTAKLDVPGVGDVDLASSRGEWYPYPGSPPEVTPAPIGADMARRDFSVNAMAIRLDPPYFGHLIDPHGGRLDLKQRQLRILHPLSFVEDPSRLYRAIRLEIQLDFRLAPESENLARAAFATGHFDRRWSERLRPELERLLALAPARGIRRLAAMGGLAPLGATPEPPLFLLRRLERLARFGDLTWTAYLTAIDAHLPLTPQEQARMQHNREAARLATSRNWTEASDRDLYRAFHRLPCESQLYALAVSPSFKASLKRLWRLQRTATPHITGHDLKALGFAPGPLFGTLLEEVRLARVEGKVGSKEEELAYARRLAEQGHAK